MKIVYFVFKLLYCLLIILFANLRWNYNQLIFNGESTTLLITQEERFSGEIFDRNHSNYLKNCTLPQSKAFSGIIYTIWTML